jgi:mannose-6-phosphate isomerase-like protein (cupin superfamily)
MLNRPTRDTDLLEGLDAAMSDRAMSDRAMSDAASSDVAAETFAVRRVVTGHDGEGHAIFVSDGVPPLTVGAAGGPGVSEQLWFETPPIESEDGGDPTPEHLGGFPADGAIACRIIRLPGSPSGTPLDETWLRMLDGDPEKPGMHRSETLDLMVVLNGRIALGLEVGEDVLGPGDSVIMRGTVHRWRVAGEQPCTYLSVLISPDPKAGASVEQPLKILPASADGPKRLITGTLADGRSCIASSGAASIQLGSPDAGGAALYDLWQTGGPVGDVAQGGDVAGPWQLEPAGGGISLRRVEFGAGHNPGSAGMHTTRTIDLDVVLFGSIELALPGEPDEPGAPEPRSTVLNPGDVVIQRATAHRWRPVGAEPAAMMSVMIGLAAAG